MASNALTDKEKSKSAALLNAHVAAAIDLAFQAKQAHWNVVGANFIGVHKLFDDVYDAALGFADRFAERARALGKPVNGTVQDARASFLAPYALGVAPWEKHVTAIAAALRDFAESAREAAAKQSADLATQNAFIDATEDVDKLAFLVESHLDAKE